MKSNHGELVQFYLRFVKFSMGCSHFWHPVRLPIFYPHKFNHSHSYLVIPVQTGIHRSTPHDVMLNLVQHLREIPNQVRDDKNGD